MTYEERKQLLLAYREAAKLLYRSDSHISVSDDCSVQICSEGAYVQMIVWIPKEKV